jgi:hypothetical protein
VIVVFLQSSPKHRDLSDHQLFDSQCAIWPGFGRDRSSQLFAASVGADRWLEPYEDSLLCLCELGRFKQLETQQLDLLGCSLYICLVFLCDLSSMEASDMSVQGSL